MALAFSANQHHFQNTFPPHITLDAELDFRVVTPHTGLPMSLGGNVILMHNSISIMYHNYIL